MPTERPNFPDLIRSLREPARNLSRKAKAIYDALADCDDWAALDEALLAVAKLDPSLSSTFVSLGATLASSHPAKPASTFADFLGEVGRAAIDTQRQLDEANRTAVAAGLATGGVPLGVFQMPKLHAEIRFALEKTEGTQLGLVFYSREKEQQSRNEQALQFDILSVPPPPDLIQSVRRLGPSLSFVLSRAKRDQIFATLDQVQEVLGQKDAPQSATLLQRHRDLLKKDPLERDTVILIPWTDPRASEPSTQGGEDGYIILYAAPPSEGEDWSVGVWQLELRPPPPAAAAPAGAGAPPSPPRLHILWRFDAKGAASENVLRFKEWVRSLGENQRRLLF